MLLETARRLSDIRCEAAYVFSDTYLRLFVFRRWFDGGFITGGSYHLNAWYKG